jgi:hypothetical protein
MRKPGTYDLAELVSDTDGSLAYRMHADDQTEVIAGSWEAAQVDLDPKIEWVMEDDEDQSLDDPEISMTVEAYARLVSRARRHCEGCSVECGR